MQEYKIYIDKVLQKFPTVAKTCRPAVVFLNKNKKDTAMYGFIVGNEYFINSDTFEMFNKSDCYLINFLDEVDE